MTPIPANSHKMLASFEVHNLRHQRVLDVFSMTGAVTEYLLYIRKRARQSLIFRAFRTPLSGGFSVQAPMGAALAVVRW
jgi:hypothetical protein